MLNPPVGNLLQLAAEDDDILTHDQSTSDNWQVTNDERQIPNGQMTDGQW